MTKLGAKQLNCLLETVSGQYCIWRGILNLAVCYTTAAPITLDHRSVGTVQSRRLNNEPMITTAPRRMVPLS